MSYSKKHTAWDNSDRKNLDNDHGKLETTHVDRYDLGGKYIRTDVYNKYGKKIDSFKR